MLTVLTTVGIVLVLSVQTVEFFIASKVGLLDFLLGTELKPDATPPKFGILPLIWGTFAIAFGSSCIALPIGLLSAIYLSEYAPRKAARSTQARARAAGGNSDDRLRLSRPAAGDPGAQGDLRADGDPGQQFNALSACIVVGVMIIPLVSSLSEDVLSAVPQGLREAAYGLGATKFEVSTRVVLPAGLSGVVASFILAISRAVGETMAVVLAAGMLPQITLNPLDVAGDHDHLHRAGDQRRGLVRIGQVSVALRRGAGAVRDHPGPEHRLEPGAEPISRGLPMSDDGRTAVPSPPVDPQLARSAFRHGLFPGDPHRRGRVVRAARVHSLCGPPGEAGQSLVRDRAPTSRSFVACPNGSACSGSQAIPQRRATGLASWAASGCWDWSLLLGIPMGIAAGVYLEEYAPPGRLRRIIQTNIANLAGVPSIVYGILGLALFVRAFGVKGLALGPRLLAGVLTLSLLILPIIVITTQEALRTVPGSLRQAALALGATRWQMVSGPRAPRGAPGHHDRHDPRPFPRHRRDRPVADGGRGGLDSQTAQGAARSLHGRAGRDLQLRQGAGPRVPDHRGRRNPDLAGPLALDECRRHHDSQPVSTLSVRSARNLLRHMRHELS